MQALMQFMYMNALTVKGREEELQSKSHTRMCENACLYAKKKLREEANNKISLKKKKEGVSTKHECKKDRHAKS